MTVHLAGNAIVIGQRMIQRCLVCGYKLIDVDLDRVAINVPEGSEDRGIGMFAVGHLIKVSGGEGSGMTGYSDRGDTNGPQFEKAWDECCIDLVED